MEELVREQSFDPLPPTCVGPTPSHSYGLVCSRASRERCLIENNERSDPSTS